MKHVQALKNTVRRWERSIQFLYRRATQRSRSLPHFIVIGAQKSGTTSIYHYLSQHSQVLPAFKKEVHFFDGGLSPTVDNFKKGIGWYRAHFPLTRSLKDGSVTGEASPLYLFNPLAAERIHGVVPGVKLIAILRNPVERAISHYYHEERREGAGGNILSVLRNEEDLVLAKVRDERAYKDFAYIHRSFKSRGLYCQQLERYFRYFDRDNLMILSSEAFFSNVEKSMKEVFQFLGIDSQFVLDDIAPRNTATNKDRVPEDVYFYLQEFFRPHNDALYRLLGYDFRW